MDFHDKYTFQQRSREALNIMGKYPNSLPIIVQNGPSSTLPLIDKNKFLVPKDITFGEFVYVIRKRLKLKEYQSIFVFVNRTLPLNTKLISVLYDEHSEDDNFLYCYIQGENVFG